MNNTINSLIIKEARERFREGDIVTSLANTIGIIDGNDFYWDDNFLLIDVSVILNSNFNYKKDDTIRLCIYDVESDEWATKVETISEQRQLIYEYAKNRFPVGTMIKSTCGKECIITEVLPDFAFEFSRPHTSLFFKCINVDGRESDVCVYSSCENRLAKVMTEVVSEEEKQICYKIELDNILNMGFSLENIGSGFINLILKK